MTDPTPLAPRSRLTASGEPVLPACVAAAGPHARFTLEEIERI